MRLSLSPLAAATTALFVLTSCDLEVDNSAPPGDPPAAASGAPDTTSGAPAAGGGTTTPPAAGGGGGATTPPAGPTATPPPGGTTPAPAAATFLVKLSNMQYVDARTGGTTTTIKVGDTVQWQNVDSMDHTATSDTGVFNSPLAQGTSFKHT